MAGSWGRVVAQLRPAVPFCFTRDLWLGQFLVKKKGEILGDMGPFRATLARTFARQAR